MAVNLSIKNVPDDVVERLRARAQRNHRSLQGELMAVVARAADEPAQLTVREVYERGRALGHVDTGQPIVELIREMRGERTKHLTRRASSGRTKGRRAK
jgi:plasmid stability protein